MTRGGAGLSFAAQNATDVRSELGARLDNPTAIGRMPLILRARLAWAHDFVNNPALAAAFQVLPGSNFIANGAPIPHDSALTSAGAELFLAPNWTLLANSTANLPAARRPTPAVGQCATCGSRYGGRAGSGAPTEQQIRDEPQQQFANEPFRPL